MANDNEKDWRALPRKPKEEHKVKYISMRVTEADHKRIMAIFGDNTGVREFLIQYAREQGDDKR